MNPIHSQWFKKTQCLFLGHDYYANYKPGPYTVSAPVKKDEPLPWDEVWMPVTRIACRRCGEELIIK